MRKESIIAKLRQLVESLSNETSLEPTQRVRFWIQMLKRHFRHSWELSRLYLRLLKRMCECCGRCSSFVGHSAHRVFPQSLDSGFVGCAQYSQDLIELIVVVSSAE
jgi:hypothetical protein